MTPWAFGVIGCFIGTFMRTFIGDSGLTDGPDPNERPAPPETDDAGMPGVGFEPTRPCGQPGLSRSRKPVPPPRLFPNAPRLRANVAAAKRVGLAMTIRTEQPEVLDPVVSIVAVYVVEFKAERTAAPLGDPAVGARVREQPSPDQP